LGIEVLVDARPLAHEVVGLEVLNITYVGPALPLAAGADPGDRKLDVVERVALELATLAGAVIVAAMGSMLAVRYKTASHDESTFRDPVSEVDHRVEMLIRARLAEPFTDHDIIGEELSSPD
jgi:Inositol monophosphatase family